MAGGVGTHWLYAVIMRVVHDIEGLNDHVGGILVPTMGALHAGHQALIAKAAEAAKAAETGRPTIVSVFVNPTQFGPDEDYQDYPRSLDRDVEAAATAGADIVFAPEVDLVYPPDAQIMSPLLPDVAVQPGLEDRCRPGHFAGVCQVVARLLDLIRPAAAVFGEKDYQQLLVVESMVEHDQDRWNGMSIIRHATVRDSDGVALSSRMAYLNPDQQRRSIGMRRALDAAAGANDPETAEQRMASELARHDLKVEYATVRDARTLMPIANTDHSTRALIAAYVDSIRLIDNEALPTA
jgi:pantoate--beta-alanine ligase